MKQKLIYDPWRAIRRLMLGQDDKFTLEWIAVPAPDREATEEQEKGNAEGGSKS
jgi:hypothetical protein